MNRSNGFKASFHSEKKPENDYVEVHVCTINCAGDMPDNAEELVPVFKEGLKEGGNMPDIFAVGL
jgi:hypothetical protein